MTYPPPPSGPPGAGGWPAGDPHESPTMYDPYAAGQPGGAAPGSPAYPGGGYPQAPDSSPPGSTPSGGYGPPPGYPPADPYQPGYQPPNPYQPGQQSPYQPDPNQPNPYQPGGYQPGGHPSGGYQPGYQQDPYQAGQYPYQPGMPGMPPQPPRRSRTGLLVGGVAGGVVLLVLLVVGGVFVVRALGEEEPDRPITEPPRAGQSVDPNPGATDAPAPPPPPGGGGTYAFVPDLCEALDLSPVFDIVPTPDSPDDWTAFESDSSVGSHSSCVIDLDDGQALGGLSIQAITSDGSARDDYEIMVDSPLSVPDSVEEVNSPWEEGQLWLGDDLADEAARVIALDNNLALSVSAWLFSAPGSQEDLEAAVLDIAEQILTVTAQ